MSKVPFYNACMLLDVKPN